MTDEFTFRLKFNRVDPKVVSLEKIPTKREFLAIVMSTYDPFGFLANFLVYLKLLLQDVWKSGIDWDQALPDHLNELWVSCYQELGKVEKIYCS